jgi:protein-disulfide isomerase
LVYYLFNRIIMNQTNRNTLIIAGAVMFAGLLITAGILFGGNNQTSNTANNSNNQQNTASQQDEGAGIIAAAEAAGVDTDQVQSCLDSDQFQSEVQEDTDNARAAGGQGTPFNVLVFADPLTSQGRSSINGALGGDNITISEDGKRLSVSGAIPFSAMQQIIDTALENQQTESTNASSSDIAINPVTEEDYIRGQQNAAVKVVEYSDFGCPYCAQFHQTMKEVTNNYDASEVAWVYRHFPIRQLHPQAPRIARASECVAEQGGDEAFWTFADEIFS